MDFEWDEAKRLSNIEERGIDFRDAALIFEGTVIAKEDARDDYREQIFRALGRVDDEYYVVLIHGEVQPCASLARGR